MKKFFLSNAGTRSILLVYAGMNFIVAEHDLINGKMLGIINLVAGGFFWGMWFAKGMYDDLAVTKDSLLEIYSKTVDHQHKMILRLVKDKDAGDWWKESE